jgi:rhodanese-related sulfurtransferase
MVPILAIAPFPIEADLGKWLAYGLYLIIGILFGTALEQAGFAYSPNLAAQFYLKDMRVLKVMFTAIITAMTLIFLSSGIGILDYTKVFVDPTYLWPGIVGGIIMGVGFAIGGFCPGTSATAAATGSIDALFYLGGIFTGIFAFGETVDSFAEFWYGWSMGRFTLPDWLNISTGATVVLVILVALVFFWAAEWFEKKFGGIDRKTLPRIRYVGAAVFLVLGVVVMLIGQPGWEQKWERISAEKTEVLNNREVQIAPGELLDLMNNNKIKLVMLDVRSESEYNLFHLAWSKQVDPTAEAVDALVPDLLDNPAKTAVVTMSNGEIDATQAWKVLVAEGVPNVYILDGGLNAWLDIFAGSDIHPVTYPVADDQPRFVFTSAVGSAYSASFPDAEEYELEYTSKVKLAEQAGPEAGGCG